jgi:hypothetical protein
LYGEVQRAGRRLTLLCHHQQARGVFDVIAIDRQATPELRSSCGYGHGKEQGAYSVSEPMKQPNQVAICIPSGRQWEADMAITLSAIASRAAAQGTPTLTINEKNSIIPMARNSMAEQAISKGATHVFWCDTDNVPPVDVIKRLLEHDKDIVGGIYCKRVPPYELLGVPFGSVDFSKGGLVPFWLMPGGCMMVKSKVYRTIQKPWYFDTARREGGPIEHLTNLLLDHYHLSPQDSLLQALTENEELHQWLIDEEEINREKFFDGKYMGEDYNFCLKAQRYGFKVWCDLDVSFDLGHIGETTVRFGRPEPTEENVASS